MPTSSVAVAAQVWLVAKKRSNVAASTLERYEAAVRGHVIPLMGRLALNEVTPGRVTECLQSLPGNHKLVRTVLSQILEWAVNEGAITMNPVKQALPNARILPTRSRMLPRALKAREIRALQTQIEAWESSGSACRSIPLWELVLLMLSTGMRIAEVLALTWENVDLETRTVSVVASLSAVRGGLIRTSTKTAASDRELLLPEAAYEMLVRRRSQSPGEPESPVFPSSAGTWLWPHNVRRALRAALRTGSDIEDVDWVRPHSLRKTAATLVVEAHGMQEGMKFLGQSGTGVTERFYFDRNASRRDVTGVLNSALRSWA